MFCKGVHRVLNNCGQQNFCFFSCLEDKIWQGKRFFEKVSCDNLGNYEMKKHQ